MTDSGLPPAGAELPSYTFGPFRLDSEAVIPFRRPRVGRARAARRGTAVRFVERRGLGYQKIR
jgi:hypothetical protein